MKVFIDTSAFCGLTISKDQHNLKAKSLYRELQEHNPIIYTSNYVLDEVYTLLKNRASHRTAVKFMDETNKSNLILLRVTEEVEEDAKVIFRRFEDKRLSFTDCTSFVLIKQLAMEAVFAFDEHFKYHPYPHTVKFLG